MKIAMMKSGFNFNSTITIWMYYVVTGQNSIFAFVPTAKTRNNDRSPLKLNLGAKRTPLLPLPTPKDIWKSLEFFSSDGKNKNQYTSIGARFLNAINDNKIDEAMSLMIDNKKDINSKNEMEFEFEDTGFPNAWKSPEELERILRLRSEVPGSSIFVIDEEFFDADTGKAGVAFHLEKAETGSTERTKGAAFFELNDLGLIRKAFVVRENDKSGETSLKILKIASDIIGATDSSIEGSPISTIGSSSAPEPKSLRMLTLPEQYFKGWNERDMKQAIAVFSHDVEYDDTAFPKPFSSKDELERHLNVCAKAMPTSFSFIVDDKIDSGNKVMIRWHVESNSEELPYTRGCSWYVIEDGKIVKGTDLKEPAVFKTDGLSLFLASFWTKIKDEPIRMIPTAVWATYIYVVFFSNWFYGLPATALEVRTWEEVRDLSLNFFFVSPVLGLPFAPVIHPGLEGIFNFLLSWAAMFAGFLSDDRKTKPNLFPMLPTVVGMQFLTSAFLLPYLATRSTEKYEKARIQKEEITTVIRVTENKILGLSMGFIGTVSILWGLFARSEDFGDIATRYVSLKDLLSIDRVGSSFLVDLAIFALFQGWLVDDDAKLRGMDSNSISVKVAKRIPFFGLAFYLASRSKILVDDEDL